MATPTATWRDALGDARVLVSGFGKWGGGIYDVTGAAPEALDDLATVGHHRRRRPAVAGAAGARRADDRPASCCPTTPAGVRSYQRLDAIRDPHDVLLVTRAPSTSAPAGTTRCGGSTPAPPSRRWCGRAADRPRRLARQLAGGRSTAHCTCAPSAASTGHKGWKADPSETTSGSCTTWPPGATCSPGWPIRTRPGGAVTAGTCASRRRAALTELDAGGGCCARAAVRRFTRGLALVGGWALVGGNAHREHDDDRAEVLVVDLRVVRGRRADPHALPRGLRHPAVPVPACARGVAAGIRRERRPGGRAVPIGAAAARAAARPRRRGGPPGPARTPPAWRRWAGRSGPTTARRCGVRGAIPSEVVRGDGARPSRSRSSTARAAARHRCCPRPIKVGGPVVPLATGPTPRRRRRPRAQPPRPAPAGRSPRRPWHRRRRAPARCPPSRASTRCGWRSASRGLGWFGVRVQAEVTVVARLRRLSSCSGRSVGNRMTSRMDVGVGEQHHEAVHADAEAAGGRQAVLEGPQVVLVDDHGLVVAGRPWPGPGPRTAGAARRGRSARRRRCPARARRRSPRTARPCRAARGGRGRAARPPWGSRCTNTGPHSSASVVFS